MSTFTFQPVPPALTQAQFNAERQAIADKINGITLDGVRSYPVMYVIRINGAVYEAIDSGHNLAYGGSSDAGSVDGDDAKAVIQAAVNAIPAAGGRIVLLEGAYTLTSAVALKNNTWICGEHRMSVRIVSEGHTAFTAIGTGEAYKWGIRISDMTIVGDNTYFAVDFQYVTSNTSLDYLQIKNFAYGISMTECYAVQIQNCEVNYCADTAIDMYGCHGSLILACKTQYNANGIVSDDSTILTINTCDIESNTANGVIIRAWSGYTPYADNILNCYFENNLKDIAARATSINIDKNYFKNGVVIPSDYAITVEGDDCNIMNNTFRDHTTAVWVVTPSANCIIRYNRFYDCTACFSLDTPANSRINYNKGYVTEAYGTANITSGNTYVEVTHGLSYTPALNDFSLSCNTIGNATKYWLANISSTVFRIYVNADPALTATFGYNIKRS